MGEAGGHPSPPLSSPDVRHFCSNGQLTLFQQLQAICKSRNEESGNGMIGMRAIRVGMRGIQGIKLGMMGIKVGMRGIRVEMMRIRWGMWGIRLGMREIRVGMMGIRVGMIGIRRVASAKSRSVRGTFHQPASMGSCLTISHMW